MIISYYFGLDQEATATVKIHQLEKESINGSKLYTINTYVTLPYLQQSLDQMNDIKNKKKLGFSHWMHQSQTIDEESVFIMKGFYLIMTDSQSGTLEIQNQKYEANIEHYVFFNSKIDTFSDDRNMWESIAFKLSVFETLIGDNKDSTSEIVVTTYSVANTLLAYIFIIVSILL